MTTPSATGTAYPPQSKSRSRRRRIAAAAGGIQQYTIGANGREVIWRDAQQHGFPPGRTRIISPYDTDARHSQKRALVSRR